jgi:hypothetical protein
MTPKNHFDFMGYTMRTADTRFTAWVPWDKTQNTSDWEGAELEHELFDLSGDDGRDFDYPGYSFNLANQPKHAARVKQLNAELRATVATWR